MNIEQFVGEQLEVWPLAQKNYEALGRVLRKDFCMGGWQLAAVCNPERIRSTAAQVDSRAVAERPCFLCRANRPTEQKAMAWGSYEILLNPYPIFSPHLTIVSLQHEPQRLLGHVGSFFQLAQSLKGMAVFFNGAACGASAPDHLHFQAVEARRMLVVEDFCEAQTVFVHRGHDYTVLASKGLGRLVYRISCAQPSVAERAVDRLLTEMQVPDTMVNAIAVADEQGGVHIYVMPRRAFRPSQFAAPDGERLLLSPATLEVAGVMVLPVEEHWKRFGANDAADILRQVCYADSDVVYY